MSCNFFVKVALQECITLSVRLSFPTTSRVAISTMIRQWHHAKIAAGRWIWFEC